MNQTCGPVRAAMMDEMIQRSRLRAGLDDIAGLLIPRRGSADDSLGAIREHSDDD